MYSNKSVMYDIQIYRNILHDFVLENIADTLKFFVEKNATKLKKTHLLSELLRGKEKRVGKKIAWREISLVII